MTDKINAAIAEQITLLDSYLRGQGKTLEEISGHLVEAFHREGRLFICGKGPFGAIASLIGQMFLHRQTIERPPLPAVALTNDAGLATFLATEDLADQIFSRQLRALATSQDILLLLAGGFISQAEQDVLATMRQLGGRSILVASKSAELGGAQPDLTLSIPTEGEPRLMECTLVIGNLLCSLVEGELFGI